MSAAVSRAETKRKATEHGVKPFVGAMASQRSGESWRTQGGAGAEGTACRQFFAPDGDWDVPVGYREKWRLPWAVVMCGCATLVAAPLHAMFDIANIVMLFLLSVVIVSVRYGLGPSLTASVLNVIAFDFFYVPPHFSFAVSDLQYLNPSCHL